MECEECSNEVTEEGSTLCDECMEIQAHEWAEPEPEKLYQVGTHKWVSRSGTIYEGEGEDSWLDNDTNDSYLDGRE
jgi:hypothetical protein